MEKPNYDNIDITAINQTICKINEKINGYKVVWSIDDRNITVYRDDNWRFEKKFCHRFARLIDARQRLDWLYTWLAIKMSK